MADRFTEVQMLKLVKIYRDYPCLWNVNSEFYKNRNTRDSAYKEIWEKLNIPGLSVKDIPKKIKNMRSSYYQELKKIEKSRSDVGQDSIYQPKVSWFTTADGFLRMVRNNQETFANIDENSASDNSETQNNEYCLNEDNSNAAADDINHSDDNNETNNDDNHQYEEFTIPLVKPLKKTKKKKEQQIFIAIERLDNIAKAVTNTTNSLINNKEDEFDTFGKYIAMSLRTLPGELGVIAKTDIQKALSDIQIKALRQKSQTVPLLYQASMSYDPDSESPRKRIKLEVPAEDP
ncbi:PREDICTED: uncharacterized protein LOC106124916 [Papilio xuthus]|uniref:Uncharacterized protein LOC106124916 n=1 Tax=Papilio xuthus TaxID=66420 RepID=A0AAJ6ZQX9_PAPXU|nr:PREDICTED: uncharacterized protein LOC106124916 [Papilio xuthus]